MTNSHHKPIVKKMLKDPLAHFIVFGTLLYAIVSLAGGHSPARDEIKITPAVQQHIADLFELTWQRKPTRDELENLIEDHIKEEVYYREALALGLDENDTIVRRRMRQKLEFLQEDLSDLSEPDEADLRDYYQAHKDKYMTDPILSFSQIVVSSRRLDSKDPQIADAMAKLAAGVNPVELSQSGLLPVSVKLETQQSVANTFGKDFTRQISKLTTHRWGGPVYSAFGTHLVLVKLKRPAKPLSFEQARGRVSVDYMRELREQSAKDYYEKLRRKYRISIEDIE